MIELPAHISRGDQEAIEALLARLINIHGRDIVAITLFGSKARGDDTPQSDIDILVIVTQEDWVIKHDIRTLGARLSLDHAVLFNLYVLSQTRWAWMQAINHPLYRQISTDGLTLTASPEFSLPS